MKHQIASNLTVQVPLKQIVVSKHNARSVRDPEAINSLAQSIGGIGQIYPVLLRRIKDEKYELFAGSRRFDAAWKAGRSTIIATILEDISDPDMVALSLAENLQRTDLTPFEQGRAILKLCQDYDMSPKDVSKKIHRPLSFVTGRLKILSVSDKAQDILRREGANFINHLGIIASLGKPRDQIRYAKVVAKQKLSEEDLVTLIRDEAKSKGVASLKPERLAAIQLFTPMRTALKVKRFAKFLQNKVRPQLVLEGPEIIKIKKALREVRGVINELLAHSKNFEN